jgi:hypothetical protein
MICDPSAVQRGLDNEVHLQGRIFASICAPIRTFTTG